MIGQSIKNALAPALFLVAVAALIIIHCAGCKSPEVPQQVVLSVENAGAVAQYDTALVECKKEARKLPKPEQFDTFVACEKQLSAHFCAESEALRKEWPRCKEVSE